MAPKIATNVSDAPGPQSPAERIKAHRGGDAAQVIGGRRYPAPYIRELGVAGVPPEPELESPRAREAAALMAAPVQVPQHVMRAHIMQEQRRFQAHQASHVQRHLAPNKNGGHGFHQHCPQGHARFGH